MSDPSTTQPDVPVVPGPVAFDPPPEAPPPAVVPPPAPVRNARRLTAAVGVAGLVVGLGLGGVAGAAVAGDGDAVTSVVVTPSPVVTTAYKIETVYIPSPPATTAPATTTPATTAAPPPAAGPVTSFGDGTYEVNVDIAPGTYKTKVPASERNCYWERMKDFGGGVGSILANDNAGPGSPITVKIAKSDAGFKSDGCGTWAKTG
ncbi:hypothetical protein ACQP2P_19360 [Dactylosporangium sp. CA-139114]|uniref:hypothetical protein n=1 Tax=Dactylosporangium sp. CA-139114 TaxID=3239931 RepID=UPI003D967E7D